MERESSEDGEQLDEVSDGLDEQLDEDSDSLDELLSTDITQMDSPKFPINSVTTDSVAVTSAFTRQRLFEAASQGNTTQLDGLLNYLLVNKRRLTSPEFTDRGKTVLLKALLNLKDGRNDTVDVFLDIAEKTGDLKTLINAPYKDVCYKGQTALHVAIERRSFDLVKLLVQKGADVQAKASGTFFQRDAGLGFYFGELPLPLAACTNQPNVVSFLMDNPHRRADLTDKDSQGNTVLHALVVIADDSPENTEMFVTMYDKILIQYTKIKKTRQVNLEEIENDQGLTPLKLAAKLGKIGLFRHILHREFVDAEMMPLCRKITEWVYGPVHSSLYDTSSIDTNQDNSVLDIIVFGSESPNRPEMLQIEPLKSTLMDKWDRFASKLFLMNFIAYLVYLVIFTLVAYYRKDGEPPFPFEDVTVDSLRVTGELITVLGAVWFLYKSITILIWNPPSFKSLYADGVFDILFFLQATLLLICTIVYATGRREYVGLLVLSLALAWINLLYYTRGSKQMGIYAVMMQRMILSDLLTFLSVYSVLLVGFSAALVSLMDDSDSAQDQTANNDSLPRARSVDAEPLNVCEKPTYDDLRFTILELFKFTIGMGNLEFTDHVQYTGVFYILLITYIVLTYILLLNMLIALMGNTVERISKENINIWNLQRASTILDIERGLPKFLKNWLFSSESFLTLCLKSEEGKSRTFFRVQEINWKRWSSGLTVIHAEDPVNRRMQLPSRSRSSVKLWERSALLERIRARYRQTQSSIFP